MTTEQNQHADANTSDKLDLLRERAWLCSWMHLPAAARDYPTMLTREELRMLYWLSSQNFSGKGCICDLGAFLGGSTMALASGLSANSQAATTTPPTIYSYDRYLINEQQWETYGLKGKYAFPVDGNFLQLMPDFLGEHSKHVTFLAGDFCVQPAPDEEIEILFVDIAKSLMTSDRVVEAYFPKLIPGTSIVVQQDFTHFYPFWDVAVMELLSEYFELLSYTEFNSAIFLNTKTIPETALEKCMSKNLDVPTLMTAIKSAAERFPYSRQKYALFEMWAWLQHHPDHPLSALYEKSTKHSLKEADLSYSNYQTFRQ